MAVMELYHTYVGDQGKALVEIVKWGALCIRYAHHRGEREVKRHKAKRSLMKRVPHQRLHVSGVQYVH